MEYRYLTDIAEVIPNTRYVDHLPTMHPTQTFHLLNFYFFGSSNKLFSPDFDSKK